MYAARRDLLGLGGPTVVPGIPPSYRFDAAPRLQGPHGLMALIAHQVRAGLGMGLCVHRLQGQGWGWVRYILQDTSGMLDTSGAVRYSHLAWETLRYKGGLH